MKRLTAFFLVLVISAAALFAAELYLRPNFVATYDTSVFSSPLPKRENAAYMKRTGLGLYFDADFFLHDDSRAGLSLSFLYSEPVKIDNVIVGTPDDSAYYWVYTQDPDLYFAIGPMFRAQLGPVSLGIAIRAEVGSNNLFTDSLNLGVQVEPYIMVPLGTESWQLSAGLLYDAHFYDFLLQDEEHYYRPDYFLLTVGGYIGITYKWGF